MSKIWPQRGDNSTSCSKSIASLRWCSMESIWWSEFNLITQDLSISNGSSEIWVRVNVCTEERTLSSSQGLGSRHTHFLANLTTNNTSILRATLVIYINISSGFSFVPRVKVIVITPFAFYIFLQNARLWIQFRLCFDLLGMPPRTFAVRGTFSAMITRVVVTTIDAVSNMNVLRRRRMIFTLIPSSNSTAKHRVNNYSPTLQTILGSIILQSNQWDMLAYPTIGIWVAS
jgi:hypothetical protein